MYVTSKFIFMIKKNYFFDHLYITIKLITVFICYEYKAIIKQ